MEKWVWYNWIYSLVKKGDKMKKAIILFEIFTAFAIIPVSIMSANVDITMTTTPTINNTKLPTAIMTLTLTEPAITIPKTNGTGKVIDENGQKRIRDNISKVKIGNDINNVIKLLGEPTILLKKTEKRSKNQIGRPKTKIVLIYNFTKVDVYADRRLDLDFTGDGILESGYSTVPDLKIDHLKVMIPAVN